MKSFNEKSLMSDQELNQETSNCFSYVNKVAQDSSEVNDSAYAILAAMAGLAA